MQKLNSTKKGLSLIKKVTFLSLFSIFFFSCKSLPENSKSKVNSLDLLDYSNNFYLSIPTKVDPDLIKRILQSNVKGLSESDADSLLERIDRTYIGLTRNYKSTKIQAAADVNIPKKYIPSILTAKKGWEKSSFNAINPDTKYDIFTQNNMAISFPSNANCCFGENIEYMLQQYNEIYNTPADSVINEKNSELPDEIYNWLSESKDVIRFFTINPQTYLSMLIGTNINLQLINVWGEIKPDPTNSKMLLLDFFFEFKSELVKKAGQALLSYTFALTNPEITSESATVLKVSGIQLPKEQLYKILVL